MRNAIPAALFAVSLLASRPAAAAAVSPAAPTWDTTAIHAQYIDGDFEHAIGRIEAALQSKAVSTHEDSIFAFKHLGVMYAASETSRERGKYYMLQLLTIEPTARIMDMYASDMIYMIFRNIQEEFEITKSKLARAQRLVDGQSGNAKPATAASSAPPGPAPKAGESHTARNAMIIGGGVALVVGAGVLASYMMQDEPEPETVTHEINK